MRTSTGPSGGIRTGLMLAAGGGLLMSLTGCGGGGVAGASPAKPVTQPGKRAMAPAMDPVDAAAALPSTPPDVSIGMEHNNGQVPLGLGQSLAVALPGNPSTGYVWELDQADTNILRRDGEVTYVTQPGATPRPGAGGTFTARFTAIRPGDTWIKLTYHRPFDTSELPKRTFAAHITVTPT